MRAPAVLRSGEAVRVRVGDEGGAQALVQVVEPDPDPLVEELALVPAVVAVPELQRREVREEVGNGGGVGQAPVGAVVIAHQVGGRHQRGVDLERREVAVDVVDLRRRRPGDREAPGRREAQDLGRRGVQRPVDREVHPGRRRLRPVRRPPGELRQPVGGERAVGRVRVDQQRVGVEVPVVEGRDLLADRRGDEALHARGRDRRLEIGVDVVIGHDHVLDALGRVGLDAVHVGDAGVGRANPVHVEIRRDEPARIHHARDLRVHHGLAAGADADRSRRAVGRVLGAARHEDVIEVHARLEVELGAARLVRV
ncbi:MAG: hypothetical protein GWN48_26300, partial [Actinobacteria bacterium]|nr:hypothetical protein [Actinomycetota bacterium]